MGAFEEPTIEGDRNKVRAQAFIDEEFHCALSPR
jgi:hypothetical protein